MTGLIRSGQVRWDDRPLWYDVYAALPPLREPIWDARMPREDEPIRPIFYEEDVVRAQFFARFRATGYIKTLDDSGDASPSVVSRFVDEFLSRKKANPALSAEELFEHTRQAMVDAGYEKLHEKRKIAAVGPGGAPIYR